MEVGIRPRAPVQWALGPPGLELRGLGRPWGQHRKREQVEERWELRHKREVGEEEEAQVEGDTFFGEWDKARARESFPRGPFHPSCLTLEEVESLRRRSQCQLGREWEVVRVA